MGIRCVASTNDVLGEVPIWDEREQALYWIDAFRPAIHRLAARSGEVTTWTPPEKLGSFALREGGGMVLAARSGLAFFDPETGTFEKLLDPEPDEDSTLLNDGRCDRRGRFWFGSMDKMLESASAQLFRLDADHSCHAMVRGITLTNGVAFSPDGRILYFADSTEQTIFACDIEPETGALKAKRVFATTEDLPGVPDGATVDAEGYLWSAQFDAGRVLRYAPDGRVVKEIAFPIERVTSCTLGGKNLSTLFVTSAFFRLTDEQRAAQPLAGSLFAVEVDVPGVPESRYAG